MFIIGLIVGILSGFTALYFPLKAVLSRQKLMGYLRVDCSDPSDRPYLFLELDADTDVDTIIRSKYVSFQVKIEDLVPHK